MAGRKATFIDGYASVQAIRQMDRAPARPPPEEPPVPPPDDKGPPPAAEAPTRIEHTTVPVRHDLVCYECGYAFTITGRIHYPLCPRCKRMYNVNEEVVEGEWSSEVRTMTSIDVRPGAVVKGATLIAQNIVVAGDVRQATLQAARRIELAPGARFDLDRLQFQELVIRAGAIFSIDRPLTCRRVDILGDLEATLTATESVSIREGGSFEGFLQTPRLAMEDGARLVARVYLGIHATSQESQSAA